VDVSKRRNISNASITRELQLINICQAVSIFNRVTVSERYLPNISKATHICIGSLKSELSLNWTGSPNVLLLLLRVEGLISPRNSDRKRPSLAADHIYHNERSVMLQHSNPNSSTSSNSIFLSLHSPRLSCRTPFTLAKLTTGYRSSSGRTKPVRVAVTHFERYAVF
jgi:hypothetical protein